MMNQSRSPSEAGRARFLALIAISFGASAACAWAAGTSLGLFFGGLFVATFLTPAGVLGMGNLAKTTGGFAAVIVPIALVWLVPVMKAADTPGEWLRSVIVLTTCSGAIGGIALLLNRIGSPMIYASAVATAVGLAWLTWPIWLSTMLVRNGYGETVQGMVSISPPLVINGILTAEPAWTERSIAYHLTDLNQDVPIQLPASAVACVTLHGIAAFFLWIAAMFLPRRMSQHGCCENTAEPLTVRPNG